MKNNDTKNIDLKSVKLRSRLTTPSSNASFYSMSSLTQAYQSSELNEPVLPTLELQMHQDSQQKYLEIYTRIDAKISQINSTCIELLKKENHLKYTKQNILSSYYKPCNDVPAKTDNLYPNINNDIGSKAINLLEYNNYTNLFKIKINDYEDYIQNLESKLQKNKNYLNNLQKSLAAFKKDLSDIEYLNNRIVKENELKIKLEINLHELTLKKQEFITKYNQICSRRIQFDAEKNRDLEEIGARVSAQLVCNRNSFDVVSQATDRKQTAQKIFLEENDRVTELKQEFDAKYQKYDELVHYNTLRRQWINEYRHKIESKHAINRLTKRELSEKNKIREKKLQKINETDNKIQKKLAMIEAQELDFKQVLKNFKKQLSSVLKSQNRRST
jgi:hypothetical protein